jgi:hypothetical protein
VGGNVARIGYRRNAYIKHTAGRSERMRPLGTTTTEGLIILKHIFLMKCNVVDWRYLAQGRTLLIMVMKQRAPKSGQFSE